MDIQMKEMTFLEVEANKWKIKVKMVKESDRINLKINEIASSLQLQCYLIKLPKVSCICYWKLRALTNFSSKRQLIKLKSLLQRNLICHQMTKIQISLKTKR